jgi:hypothetical protein
VDLNFRKAQYSEAYIRILASVAGCAVAKPEPDYDSEDLVLSARLTDTRIRSPKLAMQVKCSSVLEKGATGIAFPLPIRNYDDLRPDNLAIPRILAIVDVPPGNDPEDWLDHSPDRLCLRSTAFWLSLFGYKSTSNEVKVTVRIPTDQKLTAEVLRAMMVKIGNGDRP